MHRTQAAKMGQAGNQDQKQQPEPNETSPSPTSEVQDEEVLPRLPMPMGRDAWFQAFNLHQKQPWLARKQNELFDLLGLCKSLTEQMLVLNLLDRFTYITSAHLDEVLTQLRDEMLSRWDLMPQNTIIAALSKGKGVESCQHVLWRMKAYFSGEQGWSEANFINSLPAAVEQMGTYQNLVLVDDFVGTGKTAHRLGTWAKTRAATKSPIVKIYLVVVAAMSKAAPICDEVFEDWISALRMGRGISDFFKDADLECATRDMTRLESELHPKDRNIDLPCFGYGRSEALYSLEGGNTSNNVFPIFWWSRLRNNHLRRTLLTRIA